MKGAYQQGMEARRQSKPVSANPFDRDAPCGDEGNEYDQWRAGWDDAGQATAPMCSHKQLVARHIVGGGLDFEFYCKRCGKTQAQIDNELKG